MSNTSATGGYVQPTPDNTFAPLTFQQFLQQVFVGISGLSGDLVRPKWQVNPPKQPDLDVDWMAFALVGDDGDTFAYLDTDQDGNSTFQRMESLELQCSFYGPNSFEFGKLVRDGFQIPQNREALQSVKMDFAYSTKITHVPDLVNERWIDRYEMSVFLRREILRFYPVLYFLSASGTIKASASAEIKTVAWSVER